MGHLRGQLVAGIIIYAATTLYSLYPFSRSARKGLLFSGAMVLGSMKRRT